MNPTTNIAVRASRDAGRILLRHLNRLDRLTIEEKRSNDYVTEADRQAEAEIIAQIRAAYPGHAILAEESGAQAGDEFQWIIDPLDGTTNYLYGLPQFAVSIALKHRDQMVCGVVYNPLLEELFVAERGGGAFLNEKRIRVNNKTELEGALIGTGIPFNDLHHLDRYLAMMKALIPGSAGIRRPGAASVDLAYVATGRLDGFWELGLNPWDIAAGALLIQEAGGSVSDLSGGDRYLDTGNIVCGSIRLHQAMLKRLRPLLDDQLPA